MPLPVAKAPVSLKTLEAKPATAPAPKVQPKPVAAPADALDTQMASPDSSARAAQATLVAAAGAPRSRAAGDWLTGVTEQPQLQDIALSLSKGDAAKVDDTLSYLRELSVANPGLLRSIIAAERAKAEAGPTLISAAQAPKRNSYELTLEGARINLATFRSSADDQAAFKEATIVDDSRFASGRTEAGWARKVDGVTKLKAAAPQLASIADADLIALKEYTADHRAGGPGNFRQLNGALRERDQATLDASALSLKLSVSALLQLPAVEGTVYRGTDLPPELLDACQPGARFTEPGFASTAVSKATAESFAATAEHPTIFVIDSAGFGRDVSSLSRYENEREVLFGPGQSFKVTARTTDEQGRTVISMTAIRG